MRFDWRLRALWRWRSDWLPRRPAYMSVAEGWAAFMAEEWAAFTEAWAWAASMAAARCSVAGPVSAAWVSTERSRIGRSLPDLGRFFFHNRRRFFFAGAPFVGFGYYGGYGYDYCQPWWNGWQWVYPGYACGGYGYSM